MMNYFDFADRFFSSWKQPLTPQIHAEVEEVWQVQREGTLGEDGRK